MVKKVVLSNRGQAYARPVVARRPLISSNSISGSSGTAKATSSRAEGPTPDERSESTLIPKVRIKVDIPEGKGTPLHTPYGGVLRGALPENEKPRAELPTVAPRDVRSLENKLEFAVKAGNVTRAELLGSMLEQAKQLSASDRKALLDELALQNQLTAKAAANIDLDMWAEAVKTALGETIGTSEGQYGVLLVKKLLAATSSWRPVEAFMSSSKLAELKRPERFSIYYMLARLLVEDAERFCVWSDAPLSAKVVASRTHNLAGVFDRAFPGYLAAGLAPIVAKQMQRAMA